MFTIKRTEPHVVLVFMYEGSVKRFSTYGLDIFWFLCWLLLLAIFFDACDRRRWDDDGWDDDVDMYFRSRVVDNCCDDSRKLPSS